MFYTRSIYKGVGYFFVQSLLTCMYFISRHEILSFNLLFIKHGAMYENKLIIYTMTTL